MWKHKVPSMSPESKKNSSMWYKSARTKTEEHKRCPGLMYCIHLWTWWIPSIQPVQFSQFYSCLGKVEEAAGKEGLYSFLGSSVTRLISDFTYSNMLTFKAFSSGQSLNSCHLSGSHDKNLQFLWLPKVGPPARQHRELSWKGHQYQLPECRHHHQAERQRKSDRTTTIRSFRRRH